MAGTSSISGVISGMKTDDIISKLMELEKAPITRMQVQQATLKTKLSAWQDANTRMLALKIKTDALTSSQTFNQSTFTSNNEDIVTGSVDESATAGTYFLKVMTLAQTNQVSTQGYADTSASTIGTGSISIKTGAGEAKTIQIDSSDNTLTGLRDAINRSGSGVTASIINDGASSNPYRLLITSNTSGSVGHITLTTDLTGGTAPTISTIQADQDASLKLGDGDSAITVTKNSNTITDLIPGMTLNLKSADTTKTVTLTSARDTEAAKTAINGFVEQYNNLMSFMNDQFSFDTETNESGTLFSDSSLMSLQSSLRAMISEPLTGTDQNIKLLSQIGITSTTNDTLTISDVDLNKALSENPQQVMKLFSNMGEATHSSVEYVSSSGNTKASDINGYAIKVTTAATQARVTASAAQTGNLGSSESLTINGTSIALYSGMTQAQVISAINDVSKKTGVKAAATSADGSGSGNYLSLISVSYGSSQNINVISSLSNGGTTPYANTSGIGNVTATQLNYSGESGRGTGAVGIDIAGTINGESATGRGQTLTGNSDNTNTADLRIRVTANTPGNYGVMNYTKGVGSSFSDYINSMVAATTGVIPDAEDFIQSQIDNITTDITDMQTRVTATQDRLTEQFAAMETALGKLQSEGDYLTSQFAAFTSSR